MERFGNLQLLCYAYIYSMLEMNYTNYVKLISETCTIMPNLKISEGCNFIGDINFMNTYMLVCYTPHE